jgi:hypothetical protein
MTERAHTREYVDLMSLQGWQQNYWQHKPIEEALTRAKP